MRTFLKRLAVLFGIGHIKTAPGTWGTLVAIPIAVALAQLGPFVYMAVCILLLIAAIVACNVYEQDKGDHDSPEVVIDEVVGYMITVTLLPVTWQTFALGFVLFRLFDIWKPLFIGILDRKMKGGVGTVLDDVAAGIVANMILQMIYYRTSLLGWQWVGGW